MTQTFQLLTLQCFVTLSLKLWKFLRSTEKGIVTIGSKERCAGCPTHYLQLLVLPFQAKCNFKCVHHDARCNFKCSITRCCCPIVSASGVHQRGGRGVEGQQQRLDFCQNRLDLEMAKPSTMPQYQVLLLLTSHELPEIIPHICHGRAEGVRVNFFWPV